MSSARSVSVSLRNVRCLGWGVVLGAGCTRPGVIPHHVRWWSKGGRTTHDNLVPLCRGCHRDLHEDLRALRLTDNRWIGPEGWRSPASVSPA